MLFCAELHALLLSRRPASFCSNYVVGLSETLQTLAQTSGQELQGIGKIAIEARCLYTHKQLTSTQARHSKLHSEIDV